MKKTANDLLNLPMKNGDIGTLNSMQDVNGSNLTAEQVIMIKQIQKAVGGETEAAFFLKDVVTSFEEEPDESTAVTDAFDSGDTLTMKKAMLRKLTAAFDKATNPRELTDLTRRISEVTYEIEQIEKARERKEGKNALNLIMFNREQKAANKAAKAQ